jgi:hypothetical protein
MLKSFRRHLPTNLAQMGLTGFLVFSGVYYGLEHNWERVALVVISFVASFLLFEYWRVLDDIIRS